MFYMSYTYNYLHHMEPTQPFGRRWDKWKLMQQTWCTRVQPRWGMGGPPIVVKQQFLDSLKIPFLKMTCFTTNVPSVILVWHANRCEQTLLQLVGKISWGLRFNEQPAVTSVINWHCPCAESALSDCTIAENFLARISSYMFVVAATQTRAQQQQFQALKVPGIVLGIVYII